MNLEIVPVASLKPHPRNYRKHTDEQLRDIAESIRQHGVYRNVVVARDLTLLAGHGVVAAAKASGITEMPVFRVDVDPHDPRAIKIMVADNELSRGAEVDDRLLSELLREIKVEDVDGLVGTGFDDMMLANLVMVTRPRGEIADIDAAREWAGAGMPEFENGAGQPIELVVRFDSEVDRDRLLEQLGAHHVEKKMRVWSTWWPPREARDDIKSLRYESQQKAPA